MGESTCHRGTSRLAYRGLQRLPHRVGHKGAGIETVQNYLVEVPGGFLERQRENGVRNPFANGFVWIFSCVICRE